MSTVTHRRVKSKPFDFLMPNYAFKTAPVLLHYCKMIQKHNTEDTDMQTHSAYIYHPLLIARWLMLSTIEGAARKPHALMRIAPRNDGQSSTVGIIKLLAPALPGLCACFLTMQMRWFTLLPHRITGEQKKGRSDNEFHMAQTLHYLKSVKGIIITKQAAETTELQWENTESGGVKAKLLGTKG